MIDLETATNDELREYLARADDGYECEMEDEARDELNARLREGV